MVFFAKEILSHALLTLSLIHVPASFALPPTQDAASLVLSATFNL